jgi:hypothetical protein
MFRLTTLILPFLVLSVIFAVLFGILIQIGYFYKSDRLKHLGMIQLYWLIGNWPYRFLQLTFLDLFIVSIKEIQDWATDQYYFTTIQKTSAVFGGLYIGAILIGAVIWLWIGILP